MVYTLGQSKYSGIYVKIINTEYLPKSKYLGDGLSLDTGDRQLLESLMFDAEATRGAMSGWMKENLDDTPNSGTRRR